MPSAAPIRPAERVVAFYNHRGTCEQYIKEGKGAIKWTRLSCRSFAANAVRLQLHALAYNLGNFMRTLAMPKTAEPWSLTSLREKLIKIGAKVVSHGRYVTFQMAEVAVPRQMFQEILSLIARLRAPTGRSGQIRQTTTAEVCLDEGQATSFGPARQETARFGCQRGWLWPNFVAVCLDETKNRARRARNPRNVGSGQSTKQCYSRRPTRGKHASRAFHRPNPFLRRKDFQLAWLRLPPLSYYRTKAGNHRI